MGFRLSVLMMAALLAGCANYRAVSQFSNETTSMTGVVKTEFTQLQTLCVGQASLVLVVSNIGDDRPLAACEQYRRSQARLAAVTVDVLDGYADTLANLADDRRFDLDPDVKGVGKKVRALTDGQGTAVVGKTEADALIRVADLLADAVASAKREDAVRHMVDATPDLEILGNSLKSFFVPLADAAGTGAGTVRPPYANFVAVITSSTASTQAILQSQPMRKAEPIRTAELLRDLRLRQKALERRDASGPGASAAAGSVPLRIAAAIDAWLAALHTFATDALKPDSLQMRDALKSLREAIRVVQDTQTDS